MLVHVKMAIYAAKSASSISLGLRVTSLLNIIRSIKPQVHCEGSTVARISRSERFTIPLKCETCRYYCHVTRSCWKCGSSIDKKDLFCRECNVLQAAEQNNSYFDLLGVDENYELEPKQLTTNFRNLQRILHPDRFGNKEEEEKRISADYSSLVNKAYSTLLHPLSRGVYMLELKGIKIEEGTKKMNPEFLMDIMERNEEVDALKDVDEIKRLTKVYQDILLNLSRDVGKKLEQGDLDEAKEILLRMKYFANIESKLKDLRQRFGITD